MSEARAVTFIRCKCGESWRYDINVLDGQPVWMRPKAKRGAPCQHPKEQAEALVNGEWAEVTT